ncbi:MAG: hypothetical protein KC777_09640 [Cyanobacteria bacterium HKST-UBA02]|nr:hypothetical protein [Cyanobacteria bacterium HKST-UBA02]
MKKLETAVLAVAALLASMAPAQAYYDDYLPAPFLGTIKRYPQRLVADEIPNDNWSKEIRAGVTASTAEGYLTISGRDASGKDWTLREDLSEFFGAFIYAADLDRNGKEDIVIWFATGSCGLPWSVVFVYLFDKNGMPHKQEAVSRFYNDEKGLADLIEAPDGRGALLLIQDLAQVELEGKYHSYWRFSALRPLGNDLVEVDKLSGVKLPAFVFFTNKPNHKISKNSVLLERGYKEEQKRQARSD